MGRAATPQVRATDGAPQGGPLEAPLLDVRDLRVSLDIQGRLVTIVDRLSFTLAPGEVLGIVGESGCGKTMTARSIIGLNRIGGPYRLEGRILFKGRDLLALDETAMRKVRGAEIAMIFQHPMTSLNPLQRIGAQVAEMLATHTELSRAAIRQEAIELLRRVRIPHPERRIDDYPHQFSGGMRQRAMIAQALACKPSLLIADEPTTALDVTMQAQILELIGGLQAQSGMAMILISHDLGVIAETADRVMVMYAGQAVEMGEVEEVFRAPRHPYTAGLLRAIPAANRSRVARLPSIAGTPPSLVDGRGAGCPFRPRCEFAHAKCGEMPPLRRRDGRDHLDRCWLTEPPQTVALAS